MTEGSKGGREKGRKEGRSVYTYIHSNSHREGKHCHGTHIGEVGRRWKVWVGRWRDVMVGRWWVVMLARSLVGGWNPIQLQ